MPGKLSFCFTAAEDEKTTRLDALVAMRVAGVTRAQARRMILSGGIRVGGVIKRPAYLVKKGDRITGIRPQPQPVTLDPEPRSLDILHEDDAIIVLNKPPGLVVHPAPGHFSGTLVHALLHRFPELRGVGDPYRPGIVHRLDRDTSGLLLVARNPEAYAHLVRQFKSRQVIKHYLAVVHGTLESDEGNISLPIGRHPKDRKRMSTSSPRGRVAQTKWRIREHFAGANLLEIGLKTGRTHQIRVHCAALGCPVAGDAVYGRRKTRGKPGVTKSEALFSAKRQMLHAWRLQVIHPSDLRAVGFEAPLPKDMLELIEALRDSQSQPERTRR